MSAQELEGTVRDDTYNEFVLASFMEKGLSAPGIVECKRCSMWPRDNGLHVGAPDIAIIGKFDNDVKKAQQEYSRLCESLRDRIKAQATLLGLSFKTTDFVDDQNMAGAGTKEVIAMLRDGRIQFPK